MAQVIEDRFTGQPGGMHLRSCGIEYEENLLGRGSLLKLVANH